MSANNTVYTGQQTNAQKMYTYIHTRSTAYIHTQGIIVKLFSDDKKQKKIFFFTGYPCK